MSRKNKVIAVLALAVPLSALPVEPDPAARKEIEHLIAHLASSGCEFNRNGSWYGAARAVSHLQRKYEYLLDRNLVPTAEAFIERAASESSSSGQPYLVKCPGQPEVQSSDWFRSALATFRREYKQWPASSFLRPEVIPPAALQRLSIRRARVDLS